MREKNDLNRALDLTTQLELEMDAYTLDLIIRSRPTILEILSTRGYDVESYKDVAPDELLKLATTNQSLLTIIGKHKDDAEARAVVLYFTETPIRLRIDQMLEPLMNTEDSLYNPKKDEFVIMLSEPFHDIFHLKSAKLYAANKHRVSFFNLKNLIGNPVRHTFVPPHRKLSAEEVAEAMKGLHLKSKHELPHIKYHVDMQARVLGLVPGDIVEIKRPSETAGEYVMYRVCTV